MPRSFQFLKPQAVRDAVENQVFGRAINEEEYGDLIGDITGNTSGTIDFNVFSAGLNKSVAILIRSQNATFNTTVRLDPNEFNYSDIRVHVTGQGTGLAIFRLLAATAQQFHFPLIYAVGEKRVSANPLLAEWGYYVYPRYGFDGPIPAAITPTLVQPYTAMTHISQIMATAPGRAEWKQKGNTVKGLEFDLTPNSPCWETLNALP